MKTPQFRAAPTYKPTLHTRKAIVANYLLDHENIWIDADVFNAIGGRAGDRRMRELRADGWKIVTRRKPDTDNVWQHRLVQAPAKKVQALYRKAVSSKVAA